MLHWPTSYCKGYCLNSKYLGVFRLLSAIDFLNQFYQSFVLNLFYVLRLCLWPNRFFLCMCEYFLYIAGFGWSLSSQVWVQVAGAWRAVCTCCTEVGGWVSGLGGLDVQWEAFGIFAEHNFESFIFYFILNWTYGYQKFKSFTSILSVPREVVKCTVLISTAQNWNLSFL